MLALRLPGCDRVVGNLASRAPWDFDLHANTPTFTTSGNNNRAATSWIERLGSERRRSYMPTSTGRDYSFPWTNDWNNRLCQRAAVETPGTVYDDSAAATNLFAVHNRMHDFSYFLGLHRAELERPGEQLRPDRAPAGERPARR